MKQLWVSREIDAPAGVVWDILVDVDAWPRWGPSIRSASVEGGALAAGATGRIQTTPGVSLHFEITRFEPGTRWAWKVGGIAATDHRVDPVGTDRSRLGFGIGWPAAPYLAVCRVAIGRIERLASVPTGSAAVRARPPG
ncbi:MAG: hypothetical protein JWO77_1245 [Ilumatobacteraceae bacterium]|nr:hypothetical protein [Ilumatobacteraceae bacterium]